MSTYATTYRTHTCGELRASHADDLKDAQTALCGYMAQRVDSTSFLLRDRYGSTLIAAAPDALPYVSERIDQLDPEDVIRVEGQVVRRPRPDEALATGAICLLAKGIDVLSKAAPVPEGILTDEEVGFEERIAMRQLYLRRPDVQARMALRARASFEVREFLYHERFFEIETPHLFWYDQVATDPEIVPIGGGKAFALPSGPVVWNQYIKPGQFDRTFQLVPITRREPRPSPLHQPEYTGLDINMHYVDERDFAAMVERLLAHLYREVGDKEIETPFPWITYAEAMRRFGTDKPDLRIPLEIQDLGESGGKHLRAVKLPEASASLGEAGLIGLAEGASEGLWYGEGAGGPAEVTWAQIGADGAAAGPGAALLAAVGERAGALGLVDGDALLISSAGTAYAALEGAGAARLAAGRTLDLVDGSKPSPVWVHRYPYLQPDERGDLVPNVVAFTRITDDDLVDGLSTEEGRERARSHAFDLVIDGIEVGSAYLGNYRLDLQFQIWGRIMKMELQDLIRVRAPVESHRFGVPPHGGMTIGFERLLASIAGLDAIDEVMAYPKTHRCEDPMLSSPGPVDEETATDLAAEYPKPAYTAESLLDEVLEG